MLSDHYRRWRLIRSFAKRKVVSHAPYDLALYRSVIQQSKRQGLSIERFDAPFAVARESRIFFRHDIDYAGCVTGAADLLNINLEEKVPVAVFLRMDGEAYQPEEGGALIEAYVDKGVLFGLHTSCYVHENYRAALERERATFLRVYGFEPRFFTVHGLGELHLGRRMEFTTYASQNLAELGFDYSDCSAELRPYHRVFQDCDRDPISGERAIFNDMVNLPPLLREGNNYLVLTHPCYWKG